jgi:hypothetical protein
VRTTDEGAGEALASHAVTAYVRFALEHWLASAYITQGAASRRVIVREGWPDAIGERFSAKAVARIVKRAVMVAGFDPANFAGHSPRRLGSRRARPMLARPGGLDGADPRSEPCRPLLITHGLLKGDIVCGR